MKKYNNPEIEVTKVAYEDIITTSPGTTTTPRDENDGNWELEINP